VKVFFLLTKNRYLDTRLADGTVLKQILSPALPYASDGSVIVTADNLSDESESLLTSVQKQDRVRMATGTGNLAALRACREQGLIPKGACLVITDGSVVIHDYAKVAAEQTADIVSFMNRAFWFRSGAALEMLLDWQSDRPITTAQVRPFKAVSVGDIDELVPANQRLLAIGHTSKDALERSYTEEFGAIPPVFIHSEAEIYSSMIGPYVSIGAGAFVENCVLENCIIDDGAKISNLNLKDSIVGQNQTIVGEPQTIIQIK
jgi:hypothetical protein